MNFTASQLAALCLGIVFLIIIILGLLFWLYASKRARREDHEASAANVGRWKEVAEIAVPSVPTAPKLRSQFSMQGIRNPHESVPATFILPSKRLSRSVDASDRQSQESRRKAAGSRELRSDKGITLVEMGGEAEHPGLQKSRTKLSTLKREGEKPKYPHESAERQKWGVRRARGTPKSSAASSPRKHGRRQRLAANGSAVVGLGARNERSHKDRR
ncbi:hypothetical protein BD324DRAFT_424481 [Kockovaella imperatae]|uniref:Uncharacterized protein n=1 Tax=Kockovaella imperatae TaxID=4999 RepID=A0A1Y1UG88_9TREE|nr:hypothetical protein BD324DRAFT_424481 [Kockovaella imperatae]ORX37081.1 hypothetical protein BD324DRAFT_424481 [Kockovaella imperatae]